MRLVVDVFLSRGAHDNNLGCWTMRVCDFMVAAKLKTSLGRVEFGGKVNGERGLKMLVSKSYRQI